MFCLQVDIGIMSITLGFCMHLTWHVAQSFCTSSAFCNFWYIASRENFTAEDFELVYF